MDDTGAFRAELVDGPSAGTSGFVRGESYLGPADEYGVGNELRVATRAVLTRLRDTMFTRLRKQVRTWFFCRRFCFNTFFFPIYVFTLD